MATIIRKLLVLMFFVYLQINLNSAATPASDWEIKRWPNGTVFYRIDEQLSSIRDEIEKALNVVQNSSCVRYVWKEEKSEKEVNDYVLIEKNTTQCLEPVGRQGGEQKILINIPDCGVFGFYLHAAMQMLGFYHEHMRSDRDNYVTVYEENIIEEWFWAFAKLPESTHYRNSSYDLMSIMHYGSYQFSKNGKPTILTKSGEIIPSWTEKNSYSNLDILAINDYYECHNFS